ncbi:MAG: alpha/beta hydrolase family protein [Longimicrobiales bacterium]
MPAAGLIRPAAAGAYPAAVIIQGSGASDRANAWARSIAEVVATTGSVVLLTDKRGTGASEGDWRTTDFHELARDAFAGVAYLGRPPDVQPERIGLVGLSQGGWVAPVTAGRNARGGARGRISGDAR